MIGALTLWVSLFHTDLQADNWPAWRGPLGTGICAEKNFPTKWAVNQNTKWRVPMPERGNSSPVVWGKQIWFTNAEKDGHKLWAVCLDVDTGKVLHNKLVFDIAKPWLIRYVAVGFGFLAPLNSALLGTTMLLCIAVPLYEMWFVKAEPPPDADWDPGTLAEMAASQAARDADDS